MRKTSITNLTIFLSVLLSITFIFSCKETQDTIPTVYVDIQIDLTDPQYYELNTIGSYVYITGGVNGIILYRLSADEFKAYERTCPYDPECGKVFVDDYNFLAIDTICCGSEFSLMIDGAVTEGPSLLPLRNYTAIYNQNLQMLRITN